MVAERMMEGDMPVNTTYAQMEVRSRVCDNIPPFLRCKAMNRMEKRMPKCRPDRARTCEVPVAEYKSFVSRLNVAFSPKDMAAITDRREPSADVGIRRMICSLHAIAASLVR